MEGNKTPISSQQQAIQYPQGSSEKLEGRYGSVQYPGLPDAESVAKAGSYEWTSPYLEQNEASRTSGDECSTCQPNDSDGDEDNIVRVAKFDADGGKDEGK